MHVFIVGGSDAGIAAALRIKELEPAIEVTVALADRFPNYSICGLPFYISGETSDWHQLAHRTEFGDIRILHDEPVTAVDVDRRVATTRRPDGAETLVPYDKLILATGAVPRLPDFLTVNAPNVFALHSMEDAFRVHAAVSSQDGLRAVIVGGGYIGLEMADALTRRGLAVTLLAKTTTLMPTVDPEFGVVVERELAQHGVAVRTQATVIGLEKISGLSRVVEESGERHDGDLIVAATGVRPQATLAAAAGVELGIDGAIRVTRRMATNRASVFAAGDCVETWHRLLERGLYMPLGTTAHKQGRIAGENAIGGNREFGGSLGTQVVKVFDLAIGRTGLRESEAVQYGFNPLTTDTEAPDHKPYYPGARPLRIRITADRRTGELLGAQILGDWQAEISKRLDVLATGLFHRMTVDALLDLDLSYTPPFSTPWDPIHLAAQDWLRTSRRQLRRGSTPTT